MQGRQHSTQEVMKQARADRGETKLNTTLEYTCNKRNGHPQRLYVDASSSRANQKLDNTCHHHHHHHLHTKHSETLLWTEGRGAQQNTHKQHKERTNKKLVSSRDRNETNGFRSFKVMEIVHQKEIRKQAHECAIRVFTVRVKKQTAASEKWPYPPAVYVWQHPKQHGDSLHR